MSRSNWFDYNYSSLYEALITRQTHSYIDHRGNLFTLNLGLIETILQDKNRLCREPDRDYIHYAF